MVSSFLVEMASRLPSDSASKTTDVQLTLLFGRQEIADLLGLTIETVSRQFTLLPIHRHSRPTGTGGLRDWPLIVDPQRAAQWIRCQELAQWFRGSTSPDQIQAR
jgi:hypothetical protein